MNKRIATIYTSTSLTLFCLTGCQSQSTLQVSTAPSPSTTPPPAVVQDTPKQPPKEPVQVPDSIKNQLNAPSKLDPVKTLRKFPYPYQAMLAITSDIDDTTPEEFAEYHRFLNTKEETPNGQGLGLDIGDSIFMYMGNNQPNKTDKDGHGLDGIMTWFKGTDPTQLHDADMIQYYYKNGWIDSLHGYGDFSRKNIHDIAFSRSLVQKAWQALHDANIHPTVLINHGNEANIGNFGGYNPHRASSYQEGDNPKSPYYNADLTIKNGVRFVWDSIGETEFAWDSPIFPIQLRDGEKIWGFHRLTHAVVNHKNEWNWVPRELHTQITPERLNSLVKNHQYSILAQHLGGYNIGFPFLPADVEALQQVAHMQDDGQLLVARTSRMLNYSLAQQFVEYSEVQADDRTWINIIDLNDPLFGKSKPTLDQVRGLSFYTDNPDQTTLLLNGTPISDDDTSRNDADATGRKSISVKWFAPDYTDYTVDAPLGE